jgi:hypothetical protein
MTEHTDHESQPPEGGVGAGAAVPAMVTEAGRQLRAPYILRRERARRNIPTPAAV